MGKLILTRKFGESLKIGEDITITLLGNFTGQVKVAVEAPNEVKVHRLEFYNRISKFKDKEMINTVTGITKSWDEWFLDYKFCRDSDCLEEWYGYYPEIKSYPENWWETDFLKIVD